MRCHPHTPNPLVPGEPPTPPTHPTHPTRTTATSVPSGSPPLLQLLLPSCLAALSMGPVRADLELLVTCSVLQSAGLGGGVSIKRSVVSGIAPAAAAAAVSACDAHPQSGFVSASQLLFPTIPQSLRLPSPAASFMADLAAASPLRLMAEGTAESPVAPRLGGLDADLNRAVDAGGVASESPAGEVNSACGPSPDSYLLAHQKWPERGKQASASSGAALAHQATGPLASPCRTTRDTPASSGLGALTGMLASMDVTSGFDDAVTSMRDNLDVWVNSFWQMLREPQVKMGQTPG